MTTTLARGRQQVVQAAQAWRLLGAFLFRVAAVFGAGLALRVTLCFAGLFLSEAARDMRSVLLGVVARAALWVRQLLPTFPLRTANGRASDHV